MNTAHRYWSISWEGRLPRKLKKALKQYCHNVNSKHKRPLAQGQVDRLYRAMVMGELRGF